jgi:hypothetical protein
MAGWSGAASTARASATIPRFFDLRRPKIFMKEYAHVFAHMIVKLAAPVNWIGAQPAEKLAALRFLGKKAGMLTPGLFLAWP